VCCSVLQCVAVCCSVLNCDNHFAAAADVRRVSTNADSATVLQCAAVWCSALNCVAASCVGACEGGIFLSPAENSAAVSQCVAVG